MVYHAPEAAGFIPASGSPGRSFLPPPPQKKWSYSANMPSREGEGGPRKRERGGPGRLLCVEVLTHFCPFPRDQHDGDEHLQEATHLQAEG